MRTYRNLAGILLLVLAVLGLVSQAGSVLAAADPTGVSFTLEGCRNDGTITLPNGSGDYVCPDAVYTSGNLGKGWNELDLVPYRLTASAGNSAPSTQTYTVAIVVDNFDAGHPGYDVLSVPVLNTALSSSSCTALSAGPATILSPGLGGIDKSLYRLVTITQPTNSTCVYDYYARLALGSHLFPGSSLHANLANQSLGTAGIGSKDVSIPVKEIAPQELSKDMSATQGTDHVWSITKSATPATIKFGNVCDATQPTTAAVSFTVQWTKGPATPSGAITVVTHVYAKNPASRVITVNVTDVIYDGSNNALDTSTSGPVDVAANTNQLVLTHTTTVPSGTTGLNDIATATYTDKVTGVAVPGTTTATASATVQTTGPELNGTAVMNDSESMTGANLMFKVDSVTGASGTFDSPYTLGTKTVGPLGWTSATQSDGSSVTFGKTISLEQTALTSGTLTDQATLTTSDAVIYGPASATVNVSTDARVTLNITKTVSPALSTGSVTFNFTVTDASNTTVATPSVTFNAGDTSKTVPVTDLAPGAYTVTESATTGWTTDTPKTITIGVPDCSGTVNFANAQLGSLQVTKSVNWNGITPDQTQTFQICVTGPSYSTPNCQSVGYNGGTLTWSNILPGAYTVTETDPGTSWTVSGGGGVTVPSGGTGTATVTNTRNLGSLKVTKTVNWSGLTPDQTQTFQICITGPSYSTANCQSVGYNGGALTWTNLIPGAYTVTETSPGASWTSVVTGSPATVPNDGGQGTASVSNTINPGYVKVVKTLAGAPLSGTASFTFQLRQGASPTQTGTILETQTATAANSGTLTFATRLFPGQPYQLCEQMLPGWSTNLGGLTTFIPNSYLSDGVTPNPNVDNSILCGTFTATAGQTLTYNVDNTPPPGGEALTIGFWKNWASCAQSNGKQKPVLDQTLAKAEPAGIAIGTLTLHGSVTTPNVAPDCAKAVSILNKSTLSGKKMASDPAFNMAAQLLAARLNGVAGAGVCPAATTAINAGQALLVAINFNGMTHNTLTQAQITTLNNLATTLDNYNNNRLCP